MSIIKDELRKIKPMKHVAETILVTLLTIFAPVETAIIAILVLTVIDLITGVIAARKKGIPITSSRLRDSVTKLFIYETALIVSFILEKYLLSSAIPLVKIITAIIGVAEGKSIFENMDVTVGGNLFQIIIDKLGSINKSE